MGEAAFGREMAAYLKACPSTSPSLRHIGERLPDYLSRQNEPQLADLARLEWAVLNAFDAADACVLTVDDMAHIPAEAWQDLHFEPHPSVRLLQVSDCASEAWHAHRRKQPLHDRQSDTVSPLRVWRNHEGPAVKTHSIECHTLLGALSDGLSFAQGCERLATVMPPDEVAQTATHCLLELLHSGCLARIT